MRKVKPVMGLVALGIIAGPVVGARAEAPRDGGRGCTATAFHTCAVTPPKSHGGDWAEPREPRPPTPDPGKEVDCSPEGRKHVGRFDCPPVVITPEPMSMSLLAAGLLSMSGVGLARRRSTKRPENR